MKVLADTAVWVQHLHDGLPRMRALLEDNQVVIHPFVRGEIALGMLHQRSLILSGLLELPTVTVARHEEVLALIEQRRLWGTGLGWVDTHLLASALLGGVRLWTLDRPLARQAERLGVAFPS